jgi:aryl-alcohol dehydrogenase-like predicted oxidoreductase
VYGGLSNFPAWRVATAATIAELRGWLPLAAIEVEYSLLQRTTERELLPMAEALGLGVLGYSPLAGGLLTRKYLRGERGRVTEFKAAATRGQGDHEATLDAVLEVAGELGTDAGKVAIAWVRAKGVIPVLGAKTRVQLDANLEAASIPLGSEQMERLDRASAVKAGYPQELLRGLGR